MNYPTKNRTKAIVQTQCYVGVAFGMCDGSVRCGLEAVEQAHICGESLALHKLQVYGTLQVPNCVGSRGDALASEEATMQHNK